MILNTLRVIFLGQTLQADPPVPEWIPQFHMTRDSHYATYWGEQLTHDGYRFVCYAARNRLEIWVARGWWHIARLEAWYWHRQWWLYALGERMGFLRAPYDGCLYRELEWVAPADWRWK